MIKNFDDFLFERELPDSQGEILVLLGPPGSGKGTLSKELSSKYEFQHISTGDLIRKSEDEELKSLISSGKLVPDDLMVKILRKKLKGLNIEGNIIFDGFPRTLAQAKRLDKMLGRMGLGLSHVILLDVSEEVSKERIKKRAEIEGRKDDTDDKVIEKRFEEYKEKTLPLIDFYEKSRKLIKIPGEKGKKFVLKEVANRLDLKSKS